MKVVILENKPIKSTIKNPIKLIAHIGLDGKSMGAEINFKKSEFDEIVIQKVNGEYRWWD